MFLEQNNFAMHTSFHCIALEYRVYVQQASDDIVRWWLSDRQYRCCLIATLLLLLLLDLFPWEKINVFDVCYCMPCSDMRTCLYIYVLCMLICLQGKKKTINDNTIRHGPQTPYTRCNEANVNESGRKSYTRWLYYEYYIC